jgi:hypothetical protein
MKPSTTRRLGALFVAASGLAAVSAALLTATARGSDDAAESTLKEYGIACPTGVIAQEHREVAWSKIGSPEGAVSSAAEELKEIPDESKVILEADTTSIEDGIVQLVTGPLAEAASALNAQVFAVYTDGRPWMSMTVSQVGEGYAVTDIRQCYDKDTAL